MKRSLAACLLFISYQLCAVDVILLNPSNNDSAFWQRVVFLTQGAADDLDINLEIINADNNHILQLNHIRHIITTKNRPDYVLFMPYKESTIQAFNVLEKAKIPFVTLEKIYGSKISTLIGRPQEKYQYWLGEMYHDNIKASVKLSQALIKQALKSKKERQINTAIAITGDNFIGSFKRWHGLKQVSNNYQYLDVAQVIRANWNRQIAQSKYDFLSKKYQKIDIVWTASDQMALGVSDAALEQKLIIGRDVVIGGFDWIPEALNAVQEGRLTATVGGHFLQGAWALIKVFDHHQGKDVFKKSDNQDHIQMLVADQTNINRYKVLATEINLEQVNFAEFSLTHIDNKQKQFGYRFSIDEFIKALSR